MATLVLSPSATYTPPAEYEPSPFRPESKVSVDGDTMTGPLVIDKSTSSAIVEYSIHLKSSVGTSNAGRPLFSQGSTYGLAVSITNSASTSAVAGFQWVNVATGVVSATPLQLNYDGRVGVGQANNGNPAMQVWQNSFNYGIELLAATSGTSNGVASFRLLNSGNSVERLILAGVSDTLSTIAAANTLQVSAPFVGVNVSGPTYPFHVGSASWINPSAATGGMNIFVKATYNDALTHDLGGIACCAGILHIVDGNGVSSVPFYPNAGAGVSYAFTRLDPDAGTWTYAASGASVSWVHVGTTPNTYTATIAGGSGVITIQRTAGTKSYTAYVQLFFAP